MRLEVTYKRKLFLFHMDLDLNGCRLRLLLLACQNKGKAFQKLQTKQEVKPRDEKEKLFLISLTELLTSAKANNRTTLELYNNVRK